MYNVAVAGATGAVGNDMLRVLERREFPVKTMRLLASSRSVGRKLQFKGEDIEVQELKETSFDGIDIALFSAGAGRSKEFAPAAVKAGAVVVDNSSAFRYEPEIPLVIPEVNPEDIKTHRGIIANPNCSTIIMLTAVAPLHRKATVKRIIASTYQATSGAGAQAMQEFLDQIEALRRGEEPTIAQFQHQIAHNVIPHIDAFQENGYTKEEMKMLWETSKMLKAPDIRIACTTVRVPVLRAHSEALTLEFEQPMTSAEARSILEQAPGVKVVDDPAANSYPMPIDASGLDDILVGRIRDDISNPGGLMMWVSGDQLLKGAALNAVQIAELVVEGK